MESNCGCYEICTPSTITINTWEGPTATRNRIATILLRNTTTSVIGCARSICLSTQLLRIATFCTRRALRVNSYPMSNFRQKSLLRFSTDPMLFCGSAFLDIPQAASISIKNQYKRMHCKGIPGVNYPFSAAVKSAVLLGRMVGPEKHYRKCPILSPTTRSGAFKLPIGQYIFVSYVGYQCVTILVVGVDMWKCHDHNFRCSFWTPRLR
jgi:hypothetical protein